MFYDTLNTLIDIHGTVDQKEVWSAYVFNEHSKTSRIKGDESILIPNKLKRNIASDKNVITGFIDSHKHIIASQYITFPKTGVVPEWLKTLKSLAYNPETPL